MTCELEVLFSTMASWKWILIYEKCFSKKLYVVYLPSKPCWSGCRLNNPRREGEKGQQTFCTLLINLKKKKKVSNCKKVLNQEQKLNANNNPPQVFSLNLLIRSFSLPILWKEEILNLKKKIVLHLMYNM